MRDPVSVLPLQAPAGLPPVLAGLSPNMSYERAALVGWLAAHSAVAGGRPGAQPPALLPNASLRAAIAEWLDHHGLDADAADQLLLLERESAALAVEESAGRALAASQAPPPLTAPGWSGVAGWQEGGEWGHGVGSGLESGWERGRDSRSSNSALRRLGGGSSGGGRGMVPSFSSPSLTSLMEEEGLDLQPPLLAAQARAQLQLHHHQQNARARAAAPYVTMTAAVASAAEAHLPGGVSGGGGSAGSGAVWVPRNRLSQSGVGNVASAPGLGYPGGREGPVVARIRTVDGGSGAASPVYGPRLTGGAAGAGAPVTAGGLGSGAAGRGIYETASVAAGAASAGGSGGAIAGATAAAPATATSVAAFGHAHAHAAAPFFDGGHIGLYQPARRPERAMSSNNAGWGASGPLLMLRTASSGADAAGGPSMAAADAPMGFAGGARGGARGLTRMSRSASAAALADMDGEPAPPVGPALRPALGNAKGNAGRRVRLQLPQQEESPPPSPPPPPAGASQSIASYGGGGTAAVAPPAQMPPAELLASQAAFHRRVQGRELPEGRDEAQQQQSASLDAGWAASASASVSASASALAPESVSASPPSDVAAGTAHQRPPLPHSRSMPLPKQGRLPLRWAALYNTGTSPTSSSGASPHHPAAGASSPLAAAAATAAQAAWGRVPGPGSPASASPERSGAREARDAAVADSGSGLYRSRSSGQVAAAGGAQGVGQPVWEDAQAHGDDDDDSRARAKAARAEEKRRGSQEGIGRGDHRQQRERRTEGVPVPAGSDRTGPGSEGPRTTGSAGLWSTGPGALRAWFGNLSGRLYGSRSSASGMMPAGGGAAAGASATAGGEEASAASQWGTATAAGWANGRAGSCSSGHRGASEGGGCGDGVSSDSDGDRGDLAPRPLRHSASALAAFLTPAQDAEWQTVAAVTAARARCRSASSAGAGAGGQQQQRRTAGAPLHRMGGHVSEGGNGLGAAGDDDCDVSGDDAEEGEDEEADEEDEEEQGAAARRPPPPPLELPLELPLPLQWLSEGQLADSGLSPRDERQASEATAERLWRWLDAAPPPACRDLFTMQRCLPADGRTASPLHCLPVGSGAHHRITALAVLPRPPPRLQPAEARMYGYPAPLPALPTRGSFAVLLTKDRPGHAVLEELAPSAGPPTAAAASDYERRRLHAFQGPGSRSASGSGSGPEADAGDGGGGGGRCWTVPAVRGRVTTVAACPRGGSVAVGTTAGLVFLWRCFDTEELRALESMEQEDSPGGGGGGGGATPAATAVGSAGSAADIDWHLCARLGWPADVLPPGAVAAAAAAAAAAAPTGRQQLGNTATTGGGHQANQPLSLQVRQRGGAADQQHHNLDRGVTALAYDGSGTTLFAACYGVIAGWKLRHHEQPERLPTVYTQTVLSLTPDEYGYRYAGGAPGGLGSASASPYASPPGSPALSPRVGGRNNSGANTGPFAGGAGAAADRAGAGAVRTSRLASAGGGRAAPAPGRPTTGEQVAAVAAADLAPAPQQAAADAAAAASASPVVTCLAASASGKHLALALSDGAVHLALHAASQDRAVCVRLLPAGPQPLLASLGHPHPGAAVQLAFSPDERRLLVLALGLRQAATEGATRGSAADRNAVRGSAGASRLFGRRSLNGGAAQLQQVQQMQPRVGGGGGGGGGGAGSAAGAAAARYSLHCFPLTHELHEGGLEEEDDEEGQGDGQLPCERRGDGGDGDCFGDCRTGVSGTTGDSRVGGSGGGRGGPSCIEPGCGGAGGPCGDLHLDWLPVPAQSSRGPLLTGLAVSPDGASALLLDSATPQLLHLDLALGAARCVPLVLGLGLGPGQQAGPQALPGLAGLQAAAATGGAGGGNGGGGGRNAALRSCGCLAVLPGGREMLLGGDSGLLRWRFGE
ncbi:hypothetical protein GPECTOR_36g113 [Gonium pectorale]|uniref:Uncharacterized protein n=1 Tax=Gonium pectorale TaxID=33097 RepID=A0A150GD42_GONPE|nr:hypothetical protein GPECTOR_36g113 [Gonium pectorale]|eukprot:KXZ47260.1 hypothetical protein GPECTOR_36g113 [Gonium pectorale]